MLLVDAYKTSKQPHPEVQDPPHYRAEQGVPQWDEQVQAAEGGWQAHLMGCFIVHNWILIYFQFLLFIYLLILVFYFSINIISACKYYFFFVS